MTALRRLGVSAAWAAAAFALAACGGAARGGGKNGSITVYSGQHEQTARLLVNDFESRTHIAVNLRSSDEAALANQILAEGAASPADVFYAENPPALNVLEKHGLLTGVDPATLSQIPARFDSPRGTWVGVTARSAVLVYNTGQINAAQAPASLLDLAGPAWKGRIGFAPTETDFQPLVASIVKIDGRPAAVRWLTGLKANGKVYDSNETLIAAVNRGEIAAGLIDHYYYYRLRDEAASDAVHVALDYYQPQDPGALVDVSGAAILKSGRNQPLAQRFVAYLVSRPAQAIIAASHSWEYPLAAGVLNAKVERRFADLRPPNVTIDDLGDGSASLALLRSVGLL